MSFNTNDLLDNYKISLYKELQSNLKRSKFLKKKDYNRIENSLNSQPIFENGPRLAIIKPCLTKEDSNSIMALSGSTQSSVNRDLNENNSKESIVEQYTSLAVQILNAISALSDNQQRGKVIKHFLSISTTYQKYERMRHIEKELPPKLIYYLQTKFSLDIFKQLNDSYKMQLDQSISNVLFFEAAVETENKALYNSSFLASQLLLLYSSKAQQNGIKQRIIFLNFTGIQNEDAELHKAYSKDECLYISLQRKKNPIFQVPNEVLSSNESNFKTIYLEDNQEELTWQQFRIIYKYQIKRNIKNFKSNLFILSIAKQLDCQSYFRFTEDCIIKMISKLSILAKDKLIIHSYISKSSSIQYQNYNASTQYQNYDASTQFQNYDALLEAQNAELICYINSLEQGILSQEIFLNQDKFDLQTDSTELRQFDDWVQNLIQGNTKFFKPDQQELIQRERRNLKLDSQFEQVNDLSAIKLGVYIFKVSEYCEQDQIIYLTYEDKNLQFFTNSILYVDYIGRQIVLLQYEESVYYVYYTEFQDNDSNKLIQKDQNCQRINLSELLKDQEYLDDSIILDSSLIVKEQKVYIIYNKDASKIFRIELNNSSAVILKRRDLNSLRLRPKSQEKFQNLIHQRQEQVEKIVQKRRKPAIVQQPCVDGFDFIIFGGEFAHSNQFCNLVELLQVESHGFSSVTIPKDILFQKCGYYIPWPNMIVLVNTTSPKQYILLPGDYNNKTHCYNQVINKEHQEKAILITSGRDTLQFQIDYLKIEYKVNQPETNVQQIELDERQTKKRKPIPIQYFSGSQINIKNSLNLEQKWNIAITMLENGYSKFVQLFVFAEIKIEIEGQRKQLSITQSIVYDGITQSIKHGTCKQNEYPLKRYCFAKFQKKENTLDEYGREKGQLMDRVTSVESGSNYQQETQQSNEKQYPSKPKPQFN
ncbi:unnamed protein product (macronuclear) [Paramecium tetraurelia]|uniref:Uncharacterized protein n=1 Tax=Paramecium tetraurelia TaxID=5888 RepID=A0CNF6_PARTE|nr:uncharacterized protein GSPATT00008765001 [Paramecium tetraurelia]CAK72323.1 unnamed protein product [Paramecium tetraurelia]|eukprot:XP_001439720.1 hypothetical protein (macronuclear) [Paramecium tetraurelia strain d4-2]